MKIKFQDGSSAEINSVPAGTILLHAGDTPPEGYLPCNGAIISRTTYAKLFAKIGTRYGAGDGSLTFALPSTEDRFPRVAGNGLAVGTTQEDAIRNITGSATHSYAAGLIVTDTATTGSVTGAFKFGTQFNTTLAGVGGEHTSVGLNLDVSQVVPTSEENRPKSIVLAAYIKY